MKLQVLSYLVLFLAFAAVYHDGHLTLALLSLLTSVAYGWVTSLLFGGCKSAVEAPVCSL